MPRGQYLRIQLKKPADPITGNTPCDDGEGEDPVPINLTKEDWDALDCMDDPDDKKLDSYVKVRPSLLRVGIHVSQTQAAVS